MPCYQMNLINVEFQAKNVNFLLKALEALPYKYEYDKTRNQIRIDQILIDLNEQMVEAPNSSFNKINQIKRQYSREVLTEVAKKKRWIMKQQNSRKLQLKKY